MSPTITSCNMHANVHWVSTPNSATGDHLGPKQKRTLHQGSLAPCKDSNAACCSMTLSLALKTLATQNHTSTSPHTAHLFCVVFTHFCPHITPAVQLLPHFHPIFTLVCLLEHGFYPFLPQFYPPRHLSFTPSLPPFYSIFYPANYPLFTPF